MEFDQPFQHPTPIKLQTTCTHTQKKMRFCHLYILHIHLPKSTLFSPLPTSGQCKPTLTSSSRTILLFNARTIRLYADFLSQSLVVLLGDYPPASSWYCLDFCLVWLLKCVWLGGEGGEINLYRVCFFIEIIDIGGDSLILTKSHALDRREACGAHKSVHDNYVCMKKNKHDILL